MYIKKRIIETRIENIIIKNILTIVNSNLRIIKYQKNKFKKKQKISTNYIQ